MIRVRVVMCGLLLESVKVMCGLLLEKRGGSGGENVAAFLVQSDGPCVIGERGGETDERVRCTRMLDSGAIYLPPIAIVIS